MNMSAQFLASMLLSLLLPAGIAAAQPAPPDLAAMAAAIREAPVPKEPDAIPLRPANTKAPPEQWLQMGPALAVRNVVNPTLTPYLPDPAKANGVAVIVAPGGAFRMLAMDHEGYKVAQWLADHGVAAFLLKYRLVQTPRDMAGFLSGTAQFMATLPKDETPIFATPEAIEDAQAAVRMVRARAAEWKIDPAKVGFAGFSAGAMTTLDVGMQADLASRPDFIAPIYPPMMARAVPANAPPMFLAVSLDDPLFAQGKALGLIQSWRDAKRPLEVHLYEKGGHGFGMSGMFAGPSLWIDQFHAWMIDRKIITSK
jgi:acetyl esterase/lipase